MTKCNPSIVNFICPKSFDIEPELKILVFCIINGICVVFCKFVNSLFVIFKPYQNFSHFFQSRNRFRVQKILQATSLLLKQILNLKFWGAGQVQNHFCDMSCIRCTSSKRAGNQILQCHREKHRNPKGSLLEQISKRRINPWSRIT